ncbi:MAG: hypothetical protein WCC66_05020 [Rhizobiaceae bacterium]
MAAHLHFPEDAFTLQFLFQSAESLINIVVTNEYLHERHSLSKEQNLALFSGNTISRRGGFPSQAGRQLAESGGRVHTKQAEIESSRVRARAWPQLA